MATPAWTLIDSTVLSSSASSVTFSSIDQSYRDLVLVTNANSGSGYVYGRFNSDTGSNYSYVRMDGNGSTTSSGAGTVTVAFLGSSLSVESMGICNIMDYSATDKHKCYLTRTNWPTSAVHAYAGRWANTSAITSIDLIPSSGSFGSGSTFYLWGLNRL